MTKQIAAIETPDEPDTEYQVAQIASHKPTEAQAAKFAALLHYGVPAMMALWYLFPDMTDEELVLDFSGRWKRHPTVVKELERLRDHPLEKAVDDLSTVAYEKAIREMCWFVLSFEFTTLSGHGYKQYMDALGLVQKITDPINSEDVAHNLKALNEFIGRTQSKADLEWHVNRDVGLGGGVTVESSVAKKKDAKK